MSARAERTSASDLPDEAREIFGFHEFVKTELTVALAMFVLEAKFHSHGILGTGGTVAMVLGALLLVKGPPAMRIHLSTALGVALPFALITI